MAPKVPLGSDPRNPAAVKPWKRPVMKDDDLPPDFYALGALVLGLVGTMAKVKLATWGALMCALAALANMRTHEADIKQIMSSFTFAIMGLITNYLHAYKAGK